MQGVTSRRPGHGTTRRLRWLAAGAVAAAVSVGVAMAASTIVPAAFISGTGTVWQFVNDHAANAQGSVCYLASPRPTENYTCLQMALKRTGLDAKLSKDGYVTLFAPTDAGFADLAHLMGSGAFARFMGQKDRLTKVLESMMVKGRYTSADLAARAVPATGRLHLDNLAGTKLQLTFDRFPAGNGRVKVAVGDIGFAVGWTPYLTGETTLLDNGSVIPMDMVYVPTALR